MNKIFSSLVISILVLSCHGPKESSGANKPATGDNKAGWHMLFDGKTTNGWHKYGGGPVGSAWKINDGYLCLDTSIKEDWQIKNGGDIVTDDEYENFDLQLEWNIAKDGNSGIIFYIHEDKAKYNWPWETGMEMQVLDNNGHPDGKLIKHRAGDLYDLISCSKETVKPPGEWNLAEVKCVNGKLDLYLNGFNVVTTTLWDDNWKKMVANSKFRNMPGFGTYKKGRIGLQDHGNNVCFRNIKIRRL
jgi:hypothetical protein